MPSAGDVILASDIENVTPGAWIEIGAGGAPAFGAGWSNYGGGYAVAAFRKSGNQVFVRGLVAGGATGSTIFVFPAGYRPLATTMLDVIAAAVPVSTTTGGASTTDAAVGNTGGASAGTAHTHGLGNHVHGLTAATGAGNLPNIATRVDISTGGTLQAPAAGTMTYVWLDGSFFTD